MDIELRDQFAMLVLKEQLRALGNSELTDLKVIKSITDCLPEMAYKMADRCMKARKKEPAQ